MKIIFPNGGGATQAGQGTHYIDTTDGQLSFYPPAANATQGTIAFNGATIFTAPSYAVWNMMQMAIWTGLNVTKRSTLDFTAVLFPVVLSATPGDAASAITYSGTDQTVIALTGTGFKRGAVASLDYYGGGSTPPVYPSTVMVVGETSATLIIPPLPSDPGGVVNFTLLNPDGGWCVYPLSFT